jgi:hypothetical protein
MSIGTLLMAPALQASTKAMKAAHEEIARRDQEKIIAEVRALADAAEDEEAKAVYLRRLEEIKAAEPQAPALMGMMSMGFDDPIILIWSVTDAITSMILNAAMVLAGAGLIALKGWGLRLGVWAAWAKIARLIGVWGIGWIMFVVPHMSRQIGLAVEEMMKQQGAGAAAMPVSFTSIYAVMYSVGGVFMVLAGTVYPVICLIALNRAGVRAACQESKATPELEV